MTVDTDCSVGISSLSEGECSHTATTDSLTHADISTVTEGPGDKNITPIIAGATIAIVVIVFIIAVLIFAITFLVLKTHLGELSLIQSKFCFSLF